eukprot:CAMPEP_0115396144 /NCGR_PEP_ID=MMETSP0271-20121206/13144_1 /TAXON_ID=71861 /ORGANISM="Scrippsiella trochoidea, Strain CCMP3099" /LENGTH=399 /DNA_ID=CAMNT_0002819865 /DNA_START=334 /DNA_END=1530 /DNA_ORIENTATION=+
MRHASLAKQISLPEPSIVANAPPIDNFLPATPGQVEQLAGTATTLHGSELSVRLAELEKAHVRLADQVSTLTGQEAQVIELISPRGRSQQERAAEVSGASGDSTSSHPMRDLTTPTTLLEEAANANPSTPHAIGDDALMDRTNGSTSHPSGDSCGTSPIELQQLSATEPSWAQGLLARLEAIEKCLNCRQEALEASSATQLRLLENIERKMTEHLPSRWAGVSLGDSEAVPAHHQLSKLADSISDGLTAMSERQESWLQVQTQALQSRLTELSGRISDDLKACATIHIGEVASQTQLQTQLEVDETSLVKTVKQGNVSLENAVSAQLVEFGMAMQQKTEAQLEILQDASIELVKRQSEALMARLKAQLDCMDIDCFRKAQGASGDESKKQGEGRSLVSH